MMGKFFLVFVFFINIVYAELTLTKQKEYDNFNLNYYSAGKIILSSIKDKNFSNITRNNFALGHQQEEIWFKIDITNNSSTTKYILEINEHFYEEVEVYYKQEDQFVSQKDGFIVPMEKKTYFSISSVFKLNIPIDSKIIYYIKLKTKFAKFGKVTIYEENYYHHKVKLNIDYLYIFSFGVVLIIIIFTLFLAIKMRDIIYVYYLVYNIFYFIYILNHSGLLGYFNLSEYTYKIQALSGMVLLFLIYFSTELLETKKHLPRIDKFLKTISFLTICITPLYIIYYNPWNMIVNQIYSLTMITLIFSAIYIYFKGNRSLKYYIFAIVFYFTFIIFLTMMVTGKLPYTFMTRYGYIIASMIETIIFALMLANRYNDLKNKTLTMQEDLLEQKNKAKELLQEEVTKQTKQIVQKNIKLESLVNERELLLKEVFHRVKNNFQVVISMLWFEGKKTPQLKQSYLELINRIKSMSTVHEYLYNSNDLSHIELNKYLQSIINNLRVIYTKKDLRIDANIETIDIEFNDAITLGIIVNEVLSNGIKHHTKLSTCIIELNLTTQKDLVILSIKDNGDGFDIDNPKQGIGINLIRDFTKKLSCGHYEFTYNKGIVFSISFKNCFSIR